MGSRTRAFHNGTVSSLRVMSGPMRIAANALHRQEREYTLKFLLVGDSDVGRDEIADLLETSVSFTPDALFIQAGLIGVLFLAFAVPKTTTILLDGKFVRLQLWNAPGLGRFSTIIRSYAREVQGILLVYDITNRWSFDGLRRWIAEIDEHAPGVPRILIGNKLHLEFNRAIPRREAEYFARKRNMQYFEISTLAYFNVHESITELARLVISRNGMHWLWKSSQVPFLEDLCCRAVAKNIRDVRAIDSLPLPVFLRIKVRSFVSGGDFCMCNVVGCEYATSYFNSSSKSISRFMRA
uniref:SOCS box domain-containing protein n=1 Tax=Elaeophora elaphi TaxID=1147741 RepID=A0A0R3S4R2_9BILA